MRNRFEIFQDKRKNWRFRVVAGNSKIVAQSEGYSSRRSAMRGIEALKRACEGAPVLDVSDPDEPVALG